MHPQVTGNSIRKSMKLKHVKPGLCKTTYFLWVINVCHINLDVKVKKEEKRKIKSIMSPEDEEKTLLFSCDFITLSKTHRAY